MILTNADKDKREGTNNTTDMAFIKPEAYNGEIMKPLLATLKPECSHKA